MPSKYYAVRKGKKTGIFRSWDECKAVVTGYSGAQYKSFTSLQEAEAFININNESSVEASGVFAFVDGSFNLASKVYGYGGFLEVNGKREILQGSGNDPEMASMRNVAGEVLGSMAAVEKAIELGIKQINIYYDYLGIEMWATGEWKRNKKGTIAYYEYMQSVKDKIAVKFIKVKGHSGVEGNEMADQLAKQAVGII